MKLETILNDPALTAASFGLILIWIGSKKFSAPSSREPLLKSVLTLLRFAAGLLLVGASLDKLGDPLSFVKLLGECYSFITPDLRPLTAVVIPWLEFFTGLCLVAGFRWRGAALVFCSLMAVYSLAVLWDLTHGIDCNCGCFKMDSTEKMTWWTLSRDVGFFATGFILLFSPGGYASLDRSTD